MALDIQPPPLSKSDHSAIDGVLHHHLQLEPNPQESDVQEKLVELNTLSQLQSSKTNHQRTLSQPPMKFGTQFSRATVNMSTIESDNKRRPGISKRNASRYESPSPEQPDPNSETKTVTINRMQGNLKEWDKQFKEILQKKEKNDSICSSELKKRNEEIKEFHEKYSSEHKIRVKAEKQRDKLTDKLRNTEKDLMEHKEQMERLQNDLMQYQLAYEEMEAKKTEWEQEATITAEQLDRSEGMRRRLNDQVTELQGQLAIEEQRSKICTIM